MAEAVFVLGLQGVIAARAGGDVVRSILAKSGNAIYGVMGVPGGRICGRVVGSGKGLNMAANEPT